MANDDAIMDILGHAEGELSRGKWKVAGWWKASRTSEDDSTTYNPRCHIFAVKKISGNPITKYDDL